MLHERLEIAVAEQQGQAVEDAAGGDQRVDGLADRHALRAQCAVVSRRKRRRFGFGDRDHRKRTEHRLDRAKLAVVPDALKHFDDDQITEQNLIPREKAMQRVGLRSDCAADRVETRSARCGLSPGRWGHRQDRSKHHSCRNLPKFPEQDKDNRAGHRVA